MSAPTDPDVDSIVLEALQRANAMEYYVRAKNEWMDDIKRDIEARKDWKVLENSAALILEAGASNSAFPTDYKKPVKATFFKILANSASILGSGSSITLDAGEDITQGDAENKLILLLNTDGINIDYVGKVTSYDTTTKIASISPALSFAIDVSQIYLIVTDEKELPYIAYEDMRRTPILANPSVFTIFDRTLFINSANDEQFLIILDYLVDIFSVDLSGVKIARIYKEWKNAFIFGLILRAFTEKSDPRFTIANGQFESAVGRLAGEDVRSRRTRRSAALKSIGGLPRRRW